MTTMLSIRDLEAGYGKVKVLHGISMEVPKGKVVTLIGSNGAGKTTAMRAISGMIRPTAGSITLKDQRIDGMESHRIARSGIAHSPEGRRVFATMTVTDNLILGAFPRLTRARPKGDVVGDLERALELFPRLKERRLQLAGTLSGGEQQMLAIARGLMAQPAILILDEPSLGLAPQIVRQVYTTIDELVSSGMTVLLVDQFAAMALAVADRGYLLAQGAVASEGRADDLRAAPAIQQAYLGSVS